MKWEDAVKSAALFAQGHGCEYDYLPNGSVLRKFWYVYHFEVYGARHLELMARCQTRGENRN